VATNYGKGGQPHSGCEQEGRVASAIEPRTAAQTERGRPERNLTG